MNTIVIGAGGHAKVVLEALLSSGEEVLGLTDADKSLAGKRILGCEILGTDNVLSKYTPASTRLVLGIGTTKKPEHRLDLFEHFCSQGFRFLTVVHPTATVARNVKLADGVQVMAGAVIQPNVSIGPISIINTSASVDHDCKIGQNSHIAPGAILTGGIRVGDHAFIGAGAVVGNGLTISDHSVVAMGAAVIKSVEDNTVVAGVPARIIPNKDGALE